MVGLPRATARYQPRPRGEEGELVERLRELATKHPRFGYRRIGILLRRTGQPVNAKRVYRLWKQAELSVRRSWWSQF